MKTKLLLGLGHIFVACLTVFLAGCVTNQPASDLGKKYAAISEAMTTGSPTARENALLDLLPDAKEIKLNYDLLNTVADTNCLYSMFDALEVASFNDSHIYHVVDNYYINYGDARYTEDSYLSLLVELRFPNNENLRYAIVAQQKLSKKAIDKYDLIKPYHQ